MNENDYRNLAKRAILQTIPLETLELMRDAYNAIESAGEQPDVVFGRIIQRHRDHTPGISSTGDIIIIQTGMNMDDL